MNHRTRAGLWLLAAALCLVLGPTVASLAQGPGVNERFEQPLGTAWEASPEAAVEDGVLRIAAPGFSFRHGPWTVQQLSVRVRLHGEGPVMVGYQVTDTSQYALIVRPDGIEMVREESGARTSLGTASLTLTQDAWLALRIDSDGAHTAVSIDGSVILTADEVAPLGPGGISLSVQGMTTGEFDDLAVNVEGEAALPASAEATETPSTGSALVSADDFVWVRLGGPAGGKGYDIRYNFDDPTIWYVTDMFAGVHISTDDGYTWRDSNTGIPGQGGATGDTIPIFSLTVDPHNPQIIWAGTDLTGHIYRSSDGGRSWEQRDNGITIAYSTLTFRGFTVDPRSSNIVYAMAETNRIQGGVGPDMTGGMVFKTTDGGANWSVLWDGGMPSSLARYMWIDPRNPDVLYVSTGIFDRHAIGPDGEYPALLPYGGLGVLKSIDGGQTWRELNASNGLNMLYIGSLTMNPENPDVLLAAAGTAGLEVDMAARIEQGEEPPEGIYRTEDGGEHWTRALAPANGIHESFVAVEYCPSEAAIAYAGSVDAIYRSQDAGLTWERVNGGEYGWGPPGSFTGFPIDMQCDPRDSNRLFVNNYGGGNYLSNDGGRTWQNASQGYSGAEVYSVAVDPNQWTQVYAAGPIAQSMDGGATWQGLRFIASGSEADFGGGLTVTLDPTQPEHLLLGDGPQAQVFESLDGGATWQYRWSLVELGLSPDLVGNQAVTSIAFAPSQPDVVYAGIAPPGCYTNHEPCQPGLGLIGSYDGGQSWQQALGDRLQGLAVFDVAVHPTSPETVYVASEIGLIVTVDGGRIWQVVSGLPDQVRVRAVAINPVQPLNVLAGVDGYGIYVSQDGGDAWQAGYAGLEPNGSLHDIVFDPSNPDIVYACDHSSGVYRSADGGFTWTRINSGLRNRAVTGLAVSADGQHVYVGTQGSGVYRLDFAD